MLQLRTDKLAASVTLLLQPPGSPKLANSTKGKRSPFSVLGTACCKKRQNVDDGGYASSSTFIDYPPCDLAMATRFQNATF